MVRPTFVVHPVSAMTSGTSSFAARLHRVGGGPQERARSSGAVCDQDSNAPCAALAAARGLVGRRLGCICHELFGGRVDDRVRPASPATHSPPISSR